MGLARGLERRLERLVDGLAAHLFRGRIHPVELGTRIVREADLAVFETHAGPGAPNAFVVTLGGEVESAEAVAEAERELEAVMSEAAAERGWRLDGPVTVTIQFGEGAASSASVQASVDPGPVTPWAYLEPATGNPLELGLIRSIVGRGKTADVHLTNDDVSRQHALLWREAGAIWLADLDSANGTFINDERLTDVMDLLNGDRITFGGTDLTLRVL
ncbi:MAG: FhaA domain-containing protein [Acidimicrobiia bacterium]